MSEVLYDNLVTAVRCTNDYSKFKLIAQNREPDHVKALMVSFKDRMVPNAILCNEHFEIIDGQNRFIALKNLGMPIYYYCIKGLGIYDVASLNSYGRNWSNDDFIRMWAALGKDEYKKILSFCDEFPDITISNAVTILSGASKYDVHGNTLTDLTSEKHGKAPKISRIKDGSFVVNDIDHARYVARCIMEYKAFTRPGKQIYIQSAFVSAMTRLLKHDNFDNAEMVRKASMFPSLFFRCVNAKEYIQMLEDLWNYRRKKTIRFKIN